MLGSELSPSMHYTVVKALSRESGSIFLLEQVGKEGSKSSVSPFEALDGSLGFLPTKDKAKGGPCSLKVGLCSSEKIYFPSLAKGFLVG